MSDKNQKKIKNKSNQLQNNQLSSNKYTYDIYGRVEERSFETDSAKAGFERVENYEYDVYGRIIDMKTDLAGDAIAVNNTVTREKDEFGRDKVVRTYQADGTLVSKREFEYDEYGYLIKQTNYSSETQKSLIATYTRDEIGRTASLFEDKNANGVFDVGDYKQQMVYDQYLNSNYSERLDTYFSNGVETQLNNIYTYDEYQRMSTSFIDTNGNKELDSNETLTKRFFFGESPTPDKYEFYIGEQLTRVNKFIYPDVGITGNAIAELDFRTSSNNTYLRYGSGGVQLSSNDDYTSANWKALLDGYIGKITDITLTNASARTQITLDNDTVAKIAKNPTLRIYGDATDTVNLKDSGEFTKLANTVKAGTNEYYQYTTTVDGKAYTLQIDTDITVNLL